MAVDVWQMVQIKRVLDEFCSEHSFSMTDDVALEACNVMMGATRPHIDDPDQLLDHLRGALAPMRPSDGA